MDEESRRQLPRFCGDGWRAKNTDLGCEGSLRSGTARCVPSRHPSRERSFANSVTHFQRRRLTDAERHRAWLAAWFLTMRRNRRTLPTAPPPPLRHRHGSVPREIVDAGAKAGPAGVVASASVDRCGAQWVVRKSGCHNQVTVIRTSIVLTCAPDMGAVWLSRGGAVRGELSQYVKGLPVVTRLRSRGYESLFLSPAGYGLFRGVFQTFHDARESIIGARPLGPNAPGYSEHHVDRMNRVFLYDYPILFWLRTVLQNGASVFDLGGNVGVHYYGYRKYIDYPATMSWIVCEVDSLIARGQEIAREQGATSIRFTNQPCEAEDCEIFLTSGALQYIETPSLSELLGSLRRRPRHVFVNKIPLYAGPSYVTVQNGGVTFLPQHVWNRTEFAAGLAALGYRLRDEWETPHLSCNVPFHPERSVQVYSGLYLTLDA